MHRLCDCCAEMYDIKTGLIIEDDFAWCEDCYEQHQNEQGKDDTNETQT